MKRVYKYTTADLKSAVNLRDFYSKSGILNDITAFGISSDDIYMDRDCCSFLLDHMLNKKHKDDFDRKMWEVTCQLDWIRNSPNTSDPFVPRGELWIFTEDGDD